MGMQVMAEVSAIQKFDDNFVPNFRPNDWPKNSQPLGLGLLGGESIVGIFDEAGLGPLQLQNPRLANGRGIEQIVAAWSVIPRNVFGSDVIMPGRCQARGNGE